MVMKMQKSKKASKESHILDDVRKELAAEQNNGMADDEYDGLRDPNNLGSLLNFGEKRKHPDEIAIDEMLIGLEGNDWYLKLSKETSPNVWQFKRRIDQFRHWADMEFEINQLVRAETTAEIKRRGKVVSWGSGRYMITFFSDNGIRGNKRKPVFFDIDAQEPDALPPTSAANEMLDVLRETITSPKDVIEQNVNSMQKGMELAAMAAGGNKGSSDQLIALMMSSQQQNTQMMVGMMTAMITAMGGKSNGDPLELVRGMAGTMKDMGMLPSPGNGNNNSLTDQITLFKTLGIIKDPADSDPFNALTKMKGVLGVLQELTGAGPAERPGIMEKLIDAIGPHVGKMMGAIENMTAIKAQAGAPIPVQSVPRTIVVQAPPRTQLPAEAAYQGPPQGFDSLGFPSDAYNANDGSTQNGPINMPDLPPEAYAQAEAQQIAQQVVDEQPQYQEVQGMSPTQQATVMSLSQELATAIRNKDYSKFNRVTQMLEQYFGPGVIHQRILIGQTTAKDLVNYVTMFDRNNYNDQPMFLALQDYAYKYVASLGTTASSQQIAAKCSVCQAIHEFDNKAQWNDEAGEGPVTCGINACIGILSLSS